MQIAARLSDGVDVVELTGRASAEAHLQLRDTFVKKIEEGRRYFVLNLREAAFLDSMVIGEFVACYKRAAERGGDVKLVVTPDGMAHSLLQLTGLDHAFQIYGDEREAVASFNA